MPNFNSREVARLIIESNIGRTFSEGDDPIGDAAKILDSALLAAHPEAGELADSVYRECFDGDFEGISYDEEKAISLLSAALECAKREAAPKWISVKDRLPNYGDRVLTFVPSQGIAIDRFGTGVFEIEYPVFYYRVTHWMPLPPVDSLAEKEGGR